MIGLRGFGAVILIGVVSGCGSSSNGGSEAPLQDEYILSDQELVPESGIFDPSSRSFYVGSATKGDITRTLLGVDPTPPFRIFKVDLEFFE